MEDYVSSSRELEAILATSWGASQAARLAETIYCRDDFPDRLLLEDLADYLSSLPYEEIWAALGGEDVIVLGTTGLGLAPCKVHDGWPPHPPDECGRLDGVALGSMRAECSICGGKWGDDGRIQHIACATGSDRSSQQYGVCETSVLRGGERTRVQFN